MILVSVLLSEFLQATAFTKSCVLTFCILFAYSLRSFEASRHVLNNTDLTSNRINYVRILSVATSNASVLSCNFFFCLCWHFRCQ